jgi:hypothetical protein
MSSLSEGFQAGLQIARDSRIDKAGEEDRKLNTAMRQFQVDRLKKDAEINAELENFDKVTRYDAESLDFNSPGYARELVGIAKTRMRDLSPAARERALPQVKMLYDQFDATSKVEAEMDQRALATDYRRLFGTDPAGISYQDAKFAMVAKDKFGVDPVFSVQGKGAESYNAFDRKATQDAVEVQREIASETAGKLAGIAESKKLEASIPGKEVVASRERNIGLANERMDLETKANREAAKDSKLVQNVIDDSSVFPTSFEAPASLSKRETIMEFRAFQRSEPFPLTDDGQPDYRTAEKMIKDAKLSTLRAEAEAKRDPTKDSGEGKFTEGQTKAANFFNMMKSAEDILAGLPPDSQPGIVSRVVEGVPVVGEAIARSGQSDATQRYVQASKTWVRAKLRRESGAVIGPQEMKDEIATYFPQVGDTAGNIAQKAGMRLEAQKGMKAEAGRAVDIVGGGGSSTRVENGVLYAPSKEAGDAYLAANPNADVKKLKVGNKYFEVKKTP